LANDGSSNFKGSNHHKLRIEPHCLHWWGPGPLRI